jgi:hypothetical protein
MIFRLNLQPVFLTQKYYHMTGTELKVKNIKKLTKKQVRQEVFAKLSIALDDYKTRLGEKKFETKIKKASKSFAVDLTKAFRKDVKSINSKK